MLWKAAADRDDKQQDQAFRKLEQFWHDVILKAGEKRKRKRKKKRELFVEMQPAVNMFHMQVSQNSSNLRCQELATHFIHR